MRNRFHALCPYFAMFPESFAEKWIAETSGPGDLVLDPFCGRGTTPFQALLMGRSTVALDVNPVAFCITRAKTDAPTLPALRRRIRQLQRMYMEHKESREDLPEFFDWAFAPETLRQILFLRSVLDWRRNRSDCMIAALILGSLHGESLRSPAYLSNQMPRTISTKPAYSIRYWRARDLYPPLRDVWTILERQASYRYVTPPPTGAAFVLNKDMRTLPQVAKSLPGKIRTVVTSPPYLDVTNFEEDQWLRIWFLGGPPSPKAGEFSRDDRYRSADAYWSMIADMWRALGGALGDDASIVIRLGATKGSPEQLAKSLEASASFAGRDTKMVGWGADAIRRSQARSFRPGSKSTMVEIDCHFIMT